MIDPHEAGAFITHLAASRSPAPRGRRVPTVRSRNPAAPGGPSSPHASRSRCRRAPFPRRDPHHAPARARPRTGARRSPARAPQLADQIVALGRHGVRVGQVEQAAELPERIVVILDAQLDRPLPGLPLRRHHQKRGRLASADVSPSRLARVQRREQAAGERSARAVERLRHRRPNRRARHHVRLGAERTASCIPRVGDASVARVDRHGSRRVDHRDLAESRLLIRRQELPQRRLRTLATAQPLEEPRAIRGLGDRLRRHGSDSRLPPRHDRPDREPVRLHGDTELARIGIPRDDRVRAAPGRHGPTGAFDFTASIFQSLPSFTIVTVSFSPL